MTGESASGERIAAMTQLLVEKGVVSDHELAARYERQERETWHQGARAVSRAWCDAAYERRLIEDPKAALREVGVDADRIPELRVLKNTEEVHHLVVCTLCSCYPRAVLGDPPAWYKSEEYRARAVREPRAVLREFGVELPADVRIDVVDSTADRRFMVLPRRPSGSQHLTHDDLLAVVTRDSMVGADVCSLP